ncbi:hypothetical protein MACH17_06220 [Phaeobacter inhibens]|uniref:hypothetical protein n=1 Tax=Phaeobacter inhibens TaxID=221822 RepID=UPI0027685CF2|nr:hypothetical protein [Phaeobacter inhibens]GLO69105.1 hypothetical protein MACH17_06220 [Phaeobacter inhibens]
MFQIVLNLIIPGLGTFFMRKPFIGALQLLILCVAVVLLLTVFLTFFGLVLWGIDLVWALATGVAWRATSKRQSAQ